METTLILDIASNWFSPNLSLGFLNDVLQVQVNKAIWVFALKGESCMEKARSLPFQRF